MYLPFLLLILTFHSLASEQLKCPQESLSLEYSVPGTRKMKKTCAYIKDGSVIKHGPEMIILDGKVESNIHYVHGEIAASPVPTAAEEEEALNLKVEESFQALVQLLSILTNDQGRMNHGLFNVGKCDKRPSDWVMGALKKNDIPKSYAFDEKCDVSGSFTASFHNDFPISFATRNLRSFTETSMMVKMRTGKGTKGFRYLFEVANGILKGGGTTVDFSAKYEVDINPSNGHAIFSTQDGTVYISKINGKAVSVSRKLNF